MSSNESLRGKNNSVEKRAPNIIETWVEGERPLDGDAFKLEGSSHQRGSEISLNNPLPDTPQAILSPRMH